MSCLVRKVLLVSALLSVCVVNRLAFGLPDLPDKFFDCICEVESNCNPRIGCVNDPVTLSCGPYQIKEAYWQDASEFAKESIGGNWMNCVTGPDNMSCSKKVMLNYFQRYGRYCNNGREPTIEDYARIHNGGPQGCRLQRTVSYWAKVSRCLG
ncbi:hypothetical protein BOX15_Mlig002593g2 [Macrostomum lignano]|uniref:lysozyme n=2 Tax=Macrostomum lignano TaxID=282301 RepID=A0A1I8IYE4_9PLAT|nr:hypothetical protein BOX15_Mlig002593g2 [Macrostomum lignano]